MTETKRLVTVFAKHQPTLEARDLYQTIQLLNAEGIAVDCVTAKELKLPESDLFRKYPAPMPRRLRQGMWFWLCFFFSGLYTLGRVIRDHRPKHALAIRSHYAFFLYLACLLFGVKITLLLTTAPWEERRMTQRSRWRRKVLGWIDRLGLAAATSILVTTAVLRDQLGARYPSIARKIELLPASVRLPDSVKPDEFGRIEPEAWQEWLGNFSERKREIAERYQLPEKWTFIVASGELSGRRNVDVVVRALSALESERLALFLWGGSVDKDYLQAMAVSLGLYDQLTLVDFTEDFAELVGGCDLFIQPSNLPGSARLVVEALGLGVPVIAAETAESVEVLEHKELLYRPMHVQALVEKLHSITSVRGELGQLRKLSQERAIQFGAERGMLLAKRFFG